MRIDKSNEQPAILPLTAGDADVISALAETIWRHHYAHIISTEQIEYMLQQRYQPELIKKQLSSPVIWWRKLILDEAIIGFACCMLTNKPGELKIDKLYIHHDHHRKGYGAMLVKDAIQIMRENDLQSLILTVNKDNRTAISAYRRYGFEITGDSIVDIGNGFVMNDYLMTW
ncbi:MAG: GNAT family N-acetyltransferase, partial [Nitrosomonadaceae bacterium]|nr:GNAT family N-acetyltransferase [Nitrosomonadaceae bacterium]